MNESHIEVDLAQQEYHGVGYQNRNTDFTAEISITINDDTQLAKLAEAADVPIIRVTAEELGWDDKPFVVDNTGDYY
jgi:hypothetical protein